VRTTVTLDPDVQRLLDEARQRGKRPFKQVLNDAVRAGLGAPAARAPAFTQPVFSMGRAKVDLSKAGALAAEVEDAGTRSRAAPRSATARRR
jgi:hypothetical protein